MSEQTPVPPASNTFERIKRTSPQDNEFWSARDLARVLDYSEFRHFLADYGHRWGPYRTMAARYLWRAADDAENPNC